MPIHSVRSTTVQSATYSVADGLPAHDYAAMPGSLVLAPDPADYEDSDAFARAASTHALASAVTGGGTHQAGHIVPLRSMSNEVGVHELSSPRAVGPPDYYLASGSPPVVPLRSMSDEVGAPELTSAGDGPCPPVSRSAPATSGLVVNNSHYFLASSSGPAAQGGNEH